MPTDHLYFSPRIQISHTFCSTQMVRLANTALGIQESLGKYQKLYQEFRVEAVNRLASRTCEELLGVLAQIVKEERWGIHFEEERLVIFSDDPSQAAFYELRLYSSFVRIPVSWLVKNQWGLAWKLAKDNHTMSTRFEELAQA